MQSAEASLSAKKWNYFCLTSCASHSQGCCKLLQFPEYWHDLNTNVCTSVILSLHGASLHQFSPYLQDFIATLLCKFKCVLRLSSYLSIEAKLPTSLRISSLVLPLRVTIPSFVYQKTHLIVITLIVQVAPKKWIAATYICSMQEVHEKSFSASVRHPSYHKI